MIKVGIDIGNSKISCVVCDLKDIKIIDLRIPNQAIIKYRNTLND